MSDIGPYGTTGHPREGSMTANALVGQRVGLTTGDAVAPGVSQAQHSTAPYKKPKKRVRGTRGCYAKEGTCGAPAIQGGDYCFFHSPDYHRERREPPTTT